jgi:uroporphyrinogen-III synthase
MRAIVTRPRAQATAWVEDLRRCGIDAVALPLIAIGAPSNPAALTAAWATLGTRRLVVFVSPNAAQAFFDGAPAGSAWPAGLHAASPGPGTTAVLAALGVPPSQVIEPAADAAQFDSEALWAQLAGADWQGASILVVRGSGGRDWLAARFTERGARVDAVEAYARRAPRFDAEAQQLLVAALAAPEHHLWLFSSSEAIDNLAAFVSTVPAGGSDRWRDACAIATHPRIAARARAAGFGNVVACRPALPALVACIQSIRP